MAEGLQNVVFPCVYIFLDSIYLSTLLIVVFDFIKLSLYLK